MERLIAYRTDLRPFIAIAAGRIRCLDPVQLVCADLGIQGIMIMCIVQSRGTV